MPFEWMLAGLALLSLAAVVIGIMTTTKRIDYTPEGERHKRPGERSRYERETD